MCVAERHRVPPSAALCSSATGRATYWCGAGDVVRLQATAAAGLYFASAGQTANCYGVGVDRLRAPRGADAAVEVFRTTEEAKPQVRARVYCGI
jgi:hypothetical protein